MKKWIRSSPGRHLPGVRSSRRGFLQASAALAAIQALGWAPQPLPGPRPELTELPAGFPDGIQLLPQTYRTWSGETVIPNLWTVVPRTPEDLVRLANWALANGWRVRPKGMSHGWSPLLLPHGTPPAGYLLVDLTRHLNRVRIQAGETPATVTAETGVTLEVLLAELGAAGLGLPATPAVGVVTLGGVLAVNGHGAALRPEGERLEPGRSYGSLSNAILQLTALVWDAAAGRYGLRSFRRDEPAIQALLTHGGRALITEAVLQVVPDRPLRCQSLFDLAASEVFAAPQEAGPNAFQALTLAHGRVEAIWFPFTREPWLKVWSVCPQRPWSSLEVTAPYAYGFANWLTPAQSQFLRELMAGNLACTPVFQELEMAATASGLALSGTMDIWGPSRCSTLYVKPTTLRLAENGYAVITSRYDIQRVVHDFTSFYRSLVASYQARGEFPMNGPVEIRVTGLDQAGEVALAGALEPQLSALRPRPDRPGWDCAVWLDALTFPGTPAANSFFTELETWLLAHYTGDYADVRVEWSKGWGYTPAGPWTREALLTSGIPEACQRGQAADDGWAAALRTLNALDPHRLFSNPFLDRLLP